MAGGRCGFLAGGSRWLSLYKGVATFKHLRKTKHTHNPVDDTRGNAEALLQIKEKFDLRISWK